MNVFCDRYEYYLMLCMGGVGVVEVWVYLLGLFFLVSGDMFECILVEGKVVFLYCFVVVGVVI